MKTDIIKEFNLPSYVGKKGMTFAEASKAIDKKFEGRNDPHAQKTKEELLERLSQAQEYIKQQEQAKQEMQRSMDNNAQEVPDMQGGQVPEGMEQFMNQTPQQEQSDPLLQNQNALGGMLGDLFGGGQEGIGKAGAAMDGADQLMSMGTDLFGDSGIDTSGNQGYQTEVNETGAAVSGALSGASTGGQLGGPIGAGVGALAGGVGSLFGSKRKNKEIEEANRKRDLKLNHEISPNSFATGGFPGLDPKLVNSLVDSKNAINNIESGLGNQHIYRLSGNSRPAIQSVMDGGISSQEIIEGDNTPRVTEQGSTTTDAGPSFGDKIKQFGKGSLEFLDKNKEDIMRMTPAAMNFLRAYNLDPAEQVRRKTLDTKYKPSYADVNQMTNRIDENNVNKALTEASGGDQGALRSNILAANLNKDRAKSDAYMQAEQINRGEDSTRQQFDSGVDRLNLQQANADLVDNMQSRGARETAKQALITQGLNDIGNIGKEMQDRKIAGEATGYSYDGEYLNSPDGKEKINLEEMGISEKDGSFYKDGKKMSKEDIVKLYKSNQ